jgi:uncharacterized protein
MFQRFFTELRDAKLPISLKEYLMLMEAMDREVIESEITEFYYLSRAALVKDERNLDKFDRVFGHVFKGLDKTSDALAAGCERCLRNTSPKTRRPRLRRLVVGKS